MTRTWRSIIKSDIKALASTLTDTWVLLVLLLPTIIFITYKATIAPNPDFDTRTQIEFTIYACVQFFSLYLFTVWLRVGDKK